VASAGIGSGEELTTTTGGKKREDMRCPLKTPEETDPMKNYAKKFGKTPKTEKFRAFRVTHEPGKRHS